MSSLTSHFLSSFPKKEFSSHTFLEYIRNHEDKRIVLKEKFIFLLKSEENEELFFYVDFNAWQDFDTLFPDIFLGLHRIKLENKKIVHTAIFDYHFDDFKDDLDSSFWEGLVSRECFAFSDVFQNQNGELKTIDDNYSFADIIDAIRNNNL